MNFQSTTPRHRTLLAILFGLFAFVQAHAQVAVVMKMNKTNYLLNEPVTATIHITNHSGRQLVLSGNSHLSWLSFQMTSRGRVVPPARRISYRPTVIPVGQTVARTITLSTTYALGNMGNYTCTAAVRMPGSTTNGYTSNRVHFTVTGGRAVWVQRAGLPSQPGQIREYKLVNFSANQGHELYAQIFNQNNGRHIATQPLGKVINFRRPKATLDGKSNMHALYQVKPNLFAHTIISPNGQVLSSSYHKRGASGDPRLMAFGNGEVQVAGSVPYNPKAEAEKRKIIRNISERPPFMYK
ncbi:hypothetical protein JIN77_11160 [Verrucomicrobiaceae bacterium R5-34]|uniref:Ig-like domain-containing protein n=1 Tax=Oceaniferula flava TaxID=2800421 RepID=A0AAE2SCQ9_9BACT|nr:hypothetical protein [Oceaniferula flavus]MBK1831289.1 hypothetical protein [Verrucomicrobiaceae bacterium R5-34]MBK1855458.1 hypothetical protein [Oceaniferula flavus]MBM1136764.1 hypothetical protein [Oceaniferula flavus]